jgi:hypothetical protein
MNEVPSHLPSHTSDTLVLPLRDMAQMYNAPLIDPMSLSLPEILGISGVEYLLQHLETGRHAKADTLRLILPGDKVSAGLADQTHLALQRYSQYRIEEQRALVRETRLRGSRVTIVALILLAFFLSLSSVFASEVTEGMLPLLRKTLEYGFEIVGWVMLWHPIEVLVFEPIAINHRISALRRLMGLRVVVNAGLE